MTWLLLLWAGMVGSACRCGRGSYCPIFRHESDAEDCYCRISTGLYLQDPTRVCDVLEDHCASGPCANGGTCIKSFGSYFCSCPPQFAGQSCHLTVSGNGSEYASDVSVYFDIQEQETSGGRITLFLFLKELGRDMTLRLDDGNGWVRDQTDIPFLRVDDPYSVCYRHTAAITDPDYNICESLLSREGRYIAEVDLEYPVLGSGDPRLLLSGSGRPLGRMDRVLLEVRNGAELAFSQDYRVYTHFRSGYRQEYSGLSPTRCTMSPRLEHCSTNSLEPAVYSKDRDVIIRAVNQPTYMPPCASINIATHNWRIRGKNLDISFPGQHILKLEGSRLPSGNLTIEYRINIYGSEKLTQNKSDFPNLARCWVEIRPVPLVIEIMGGSLRTVARRAKFKMDASFSRDLNHPDDSNLRYLWTCDHPKPKFCSRKGPVERSEAMVVSMPVGEHTFTLRLRSEGLDDELYSKEKQQKIIVKREGDIYPRFNILCCEKRRCENLDPGWVLCLKLAEYPEGEEMVWTYWKDGGIEGPLGEIQQDGTPSHQIIVKGGSLQPSSVYHFKAVYKDTSCIYTVTTNAEVSQGKCSMSPSSGVAAETEYSLECQGFASLSNDTGPVFYEVYEKRASGHALLLRTSQEPKMTHLLLSSGDLTVRVVNRFGGFIKIDVSVLVDPGPGVTVDYVEKILEKMEVSIAGGDSTAALACSNILASKLSEVNDKPRTLERHLWIIRHMDLVDFWDGKRVLGCLWYLMSQITDGADLSSVALREAATILGSVVSIISENKKLLYIFPPEDTLQIAREVLGIISTLLMSKDPRVTGVKVIPFDYESSYLEYWLGFTKILTVLEVTGDLLLDSMVQYQDELHVSSGEVFMVTKFASGKFLSEQPEVDPSGSGAASLGLGQRFGLVYQHDLLQLQVTELKKDPFWWVKSELPANSHHLNVRIRLEGQVLVELREYINITFQASNMTSELVEGSVIQPKQSLTANEKDKFVSIHKIDRAKDGSGKISVKFKNLGSTLLQVLLKVNSIPEAAVIREQGGKVDSSSPEFLSEVYLKERAEDILYLGILPSQEHKEGENLSYSFEIHDELCRVWSWEEWNVASCEVGESSTSEKVHCMCRHLSFFGGTFFIPPNSIHPVADIQLFRNVLDNPYVLLLVIFLLLAYAGLLFWAARMDKRDELSRGIHILPDNFPGDDYGFLLAVFSGVNAKGGTSSKVGIRLFGSKAHGHPHILNFNSHFLQLGQDNWFLLFTQEYLGRITKIHVWHNNHGPRPDWYCRKILLYDLTKDRQYIFEVERWLTLRIEGAQWILRPISRKVPQSLGRLAKDNVFSGLRERHNWFSVFAKDPRSGYSRCEKLTIGLTIMIVAMFAAILFYGVTKEYREDQPQYAFGMGEIIVMLEITAISIIMSTIAIKLFNMSKMPTKRKSTEKKRVTRAFPDYTSTKGKARGWVKRWVEATLVLEPLQTIHMASNERRPLPLRKKVILIIAWTVSIVMILGCAFFLVLYGLKFGPNKSLIWISVILLNLGKTVFFTQPLKVAALALAATFCLKIPNRETLAFEVEPKGIEAELRKDRDFMRKLIEMRSHPMYRPLSQLDVMVGLDKREKAEDKWDLVNLLLVITTYLLLLILILSTHGSLQATQYYTEHIYHILNPNSTSWTRPSLHNVFDKESFFLYLMYDLLPALHVTTQYNGEPLPKTGEEEGMELEEVKGWTSDYMNRLLGVPWLRQLRVTDGSCQVAEEMSGWFGECHGPLGATEVEAYSEHWKSEGPLLWNYSSPQQSESISVFGASGLSYPGGGYIQNMTEHLNSSQHKLSRLYLRNWLDSRTRAVIVEFNLYNTHGNIFALVSLIVECLPSGVYTTRLNVDSAQYEFFRHTNDVKLIMIVSIFLIITLLLLTKLITDISVEGFLMYMKNWGHIVDTLVVIFNFSSIIAILVRAQYFSFYSKKFYEPVRDVFISFIYPFYQDDILTISLCLLIIILTVRILTLLHYGKYCFVLKHVLRDSFKFIMAIIFLLTFLTTIVAIVMFSCRTQHSFIFPILPFPRINFVNFYSNARLQNESIIFPTLVNLIYLFGMVLMTCVLIFNYGKAKFNLDVLGVGEGYTNIFPNMRRKLNRNVKVRMSFMRSEEDTNIKDGHRKYSGSDAIRKWIKRSKIKHEKTHNQLNILIDIFEKEYISV